MPEVLLGGVSDSSRTGRRWSLLPVSIVAHGCAAVASIVIPLLADIAPPPLYRMAPSFIHAASVKALEVPVARGDARGPSRAAPTDAPGRLPTSTEPPTPTGGGNDPGVTPRGIETGAIGGFGPIGETVAGDPPALPDPPAPQPRRVVTVGGAISAPRKIAGLAPQYPAIARNARVEGTVILEAVINERGAIERLKVLRSVPLLDTAAMDAVSEWRYTPTLLNNVPVPVLMTITVTFSLHR
jgi:protein TonB